jgi:secondary thiamine-phosphate synthase enzyme
MFAPAPPATGALGDGSAAMEPLHMDTTALAAAYSLHPSMPWFQHEVRLAPRPRGFHLITAEVAAALRDIEPVRIGLLHVFILHTSASLSINENADPDVPRDLETACNAIAPEDFPYRHTCEGPDDMPAHVKATLIGSSVTVPIRDGGLALGTWQGVYLCEHRDHGGPRRLLLTLCGER